MNWRLTTNTAKQNMNLKKYHPTHDDQVPGLWNLLVWVQLLITQNKTRPDPKSMDTKWVLIYLLYKPHNTACICNDINVLHRQRAFQGTQTSLHSEFYGDTSSTTNGSTHLCDAHSHWLSQWWGEDETIQSETMFTWYKAEAPGLATILVICGMVSSVTNPYSPMSLSSHVFPLADVIGEDKTSAVGENLTFQCNYSGSSGVRHICKGSLNECQHMLNTSHPKTPRYSMEDAQKNMTLTITIKNLEHKDRGLYWCYTASPDRPFKIHRKLNLTTMGESPWLDRTRVWFSPSDLDGPHSTRVWMCRG